MWNDVAEANVGVKGLFNVVLTVLVITGELDSGGEVLVTPGVALVFVEGGSGGVLLLLLGWRELG